MAIINKKPIKAQKGVLGGLDPYIRRARNFLGDVFGEITEAAEQASGRQSSAAADDYWSDETALRRREEYQRRQEENRANLEEVRQMSNRSRTVDPNNTRQAAAETLDRAEAQRSADIQAGVERMDAAREADRTMREAGFAEPDIARRVDAILAGEELPSPPESVNLDPETLPFEPSTRQTHAETPPQRPQSQTIDTEEEGFNWDELEWEGVNDPLEEEYNRTNRQRTGSQPEQPSGKRYPSEIPQRFEFEYIGGQKQEPHFKAGTKPKHIDEARRDWQFYSPEYMPYGENIQRYIDEAKSRGASPERISKQLRGMRFLVDKHMLPEADYELSDMYGNLHFDTDITRKGGMPTTFSGDVAVPDMGYSEVTMPHRMMTISGRDPVGRGSNNKGGNINFNARFDDEGNPYFGVTSFWGNNPYNAGKAYNTMFGHMLPGEYIHDKTGYSANSYSAVLNMIQNKRMTPEFTGPTHSNSMATYGSWPGTEPERFVRDEAGKIVKDAEGDPVRRPREDIEAEEIRSNTFYDRETGQEVVDKMNANLEGILQKIGIDNPDARVRLDTDNRLILPNFKAIKNRKFGGILMDK